MTYSTLRKQDIIPCVVCEDRIPDFDVQKNDITRKYRVKNTAVSIAILYLEIPGK